MRGNPLFSAVGAALVLGSPGCSNDDPPPAGPATGPVRRIASEADLVGGPEATGRPQDFVLDNGRVRFVVQAPGSSTGWGLYGGALVDAAGSGALGGDRLEEVFVQCDLRGFRPTEATVVAAGGPEEAGVLRLTGHDAGIPFLDAILPRDPLEVAITVEYILEPDADAVEIEIRAKDLRKRGARELSCGLMLLPGDAHQLFTAGDGFFEPRGGTFDHLIMSAWDAPASLYLYDPDEPLEVIIAEAGLMPIAPPPRPFLANATLVDRYVLGVGRGGDVESALASLRAREPDEVSRRPVLVGLEGLGALDLPFDAAVLTFTDGEGQTVTSARSSLADAVVRARLAPGAYRVDATLEGRAVPGFELEVPPGSAEAPVRVSHRLEGLGVVTVTSVELGLDGQPVGRTPARLRLIEGAGADPGAGPALERYVGVQESLFMPEGAYTLVASRGPEHELFVRDVTVTAGEEVEVQARLRRAVDTTGWASADLHVHGTRSSDSETARRVRVLGAAAEGLDILVATDHDAVTDYGPTAEALGLEDRLRTVSGTEMSMLYGHMNGYPVPATEPNDHWRPAWFVYDGPSFERVLEPHEVADALRAEGAEVVQANHPRSSQGVFNYLDVDDATGESTGPWPGFDAVEILNGKRLGEYPEVIASVRGLFAAGRRFTLVGSSDIHRDIGVGYARTYVPWDGGDLAEVWSTLKAGRAMAALGAFVEVEARPPSAEPVGAGGAIPATGPVELAIRVQAPSWVRLDAVRVFEGAGVVAERPIPAEGPDPSRPGLRFEGTVTATPTAGAYYMVEVRGSRSPPLLDEVLTVTNPIWVE